MLTLLLTRWLDTGLTRFVLTPVLSHLLTLVLVFDFAGGRLGEFLVDRLRLFEAYDRRQEVVLQPHPGGVKGVHHLKVECYLRVLFR